MHKERAPPQDLPAQPARLGMTSQNDDILHLEGQLLEESVRGAVFLANSLQVKGCFRLEPVPVDKSLSVCR